MKNNMIDHGRAFDWGCTSSDFAGQKLDSEQLEGVTGGADAMDWIGLGFSIYDLLNNPDATRRGSKGGSKRFN